MAFAGSGGDPEAEDENEHEDEDYIPFSEDTPDYEQPAPGVVLEELEYAPTPFLRRRALAAERNLRRRIGRVRGRPRPPRLIDEVEEEGQDSDMEVLEIRRGTQGSETDGAGRVETCGDVEEKLDSSSLPNCPVCMEQWTHEGVHRICCIPCGHVYGRSCIERWARHCGKNYAKCPQCNRKFRMKQIINLYAPRIAVASEHLEKEVRFLRTKNESLSVENKRLLEEVHKHKKQACLDHVSLGATLMRPFDHCNMGQRSLLQNFSESDFVSQNSIQGGSDLCHFVLLVEMEVNEARVLGIDTSNQIVVISRAAPSLGGEHFITKVSLVVPHAMEHFQLPQDTGAIRDLQTAPSTAILPGRLALLASLGKKLSVVSMESNNIVLKYDLPGPAWSCSWDLNNPELLYTGLQNGTLLVFDIRQTARPLRSNSGSSGHLVHTIHSVVKNHVNVSRTLLTASSVGPCLWNGSAVGESPFFIPEMERYGVCISLACGRTSDDMVASFRPKVDIPIDSVTPRSSQSRSPVVNGPAKIGTHVVLRRFDNNCYRACESSSGSVSELRMSRSVIIPTEGNNPLFVYGDEAFRGLCVWELPSLQVVHRFQPHQHPILDIKYSRTLGMLTSISKSKLQIFSCS